MPQPSTLLVIADIGGYTRFLRLHAVSIVHAQHVVGKLLEAVIDAVRPRLALAKLEGDAAFFHAPLAREPQSLAALAERMHAAFHRRRADLAQNALCPCDGCRQAGELRIKVVAHAGEAATQRIASRAELAGLDVILVHRLLKNSVPIDEYLLLTPEALAVVDEARRRGALPLAMEVDGFGMLQTHYLALTSTPSDAPDPVKALPRRFARQLSLAWQTLPYLIRGKRACADFRNVDTSRDA